MLKVYIDADSFEEPQLMELAEDAPVDRLVPALVRELEIPQTDSAGKQLVYVLRHLRDGKVLPGNTSLRASGVQPETYLALEAYTANGLPVPMSSFQEKAKARSKQRFSPAPQAVANASPVPISARQTASVSQDANFYSDQTITDANAFITNAAHIQAAYGPDNAIPTAQPIPSTVPAIPMRPPTPRPERHWSRRALFLLGGAVLGATGISVGYAAFRSLNSKRPLATPTNTTSQMAATVGPKTVPTATPQQTFMPTRATELLTFMQHQQTVHSVTWSPDGTMLASGANDKLVLTWNLAGQTLLRKKQEKAVVAVAWSPDSDLLAIGSGNQVAFLNAQDGTPQATRDHKNVTTLAWSPKQPQMLVSAGMDRLAVVWDTQTFKPQTVFNMHSTGISASSWASDSQTIGTSSTGGVIRVWAAQNAQQVHGFFSDGVAINALAFNPVGMSLAAGGMDGVLRLWQSGLTCQQMQQGQCTDPPQSLRMHTLPIRAIAWSPDGRFLATGDDDGQLLVWSPAQSQTPLLNVAQDNPILSLAWSPDGKKIASASGNTVTLWALAQ